MVYVLLVVVKEVILLFCEFVRLKSDLKTMCRLWWSFKGGILTLVNSTEDIKCVTFLCLIPALFLESKIGLMRTPVTDCFDFGYKLAACLI